MPLLYPIAANAREALDSEGGARTISEARELARASVMLVSDWLRPQAAEREEVQGKAEAGISRGFVQLYEDAKGQPVIAVTYWKPDAGVKTNARKAKPRDKPAEDHTDDLYFNKRGAKAKAKKRKRLSDPNQMDLFGPDQQGAEHVDPHNPLVVIVDEEGDGATFGGIEGES